VLALVGTYQVHVEPPLGFAALTEQVKIDASTTERIFIVSKSDRVTPPDDFSPVRGQVVTNVKGRFMPVGGAEVLFARGRQSSTATTDARGAFNIRLADGNYDVRVTAAGFQTL